MSSWQESYGHVMGSRGGFTAGRMDGSIQLEGIEDALKRLDAIAVKNPNFEKQLNNIVKYVIRKTAAKTKQSAKGVMLSDVRKSYLAVKSMVYKRVFGGNVNIISRRKRTGYSASLPAQHDQGKNWGGNRRKRSERTEQIMTYWGADRGFILRFLNDGTKARRIHTLNNTRVNKNVGRGHSSASLEGQRTGNRGRISARNWFKGASMMALEDESRKMAIMIEDAIRGQWDGASASLDYDINDNR